MTRLCGKRSRYGIARGASTRADSRFLFSNDLVLQDAIDGTFGAAAPLVTLGGLVWVNRARRAAERKAARAAREAAAKAAGAVAEAAVSGAKATAEEIGAQQWAKLLVCLAIDLGGDSSFLLPGLGEATDAVYAPLEALTLTQLFGSGALAGLGFVEEALPFSDALPTATLAWVLETVFPESAPAKWLGVGAAAKGKNRDEKKKKK